MTFCLLSLIITLFSENSTTFSTGFNHCNFSFPSRSRNSGMDFFHSLPVPEFREWIFSFTSRSQILGMDFFHSLPVPDFWEWIFFIPFPFPNFGNGFFSFPFRSRTLGMDFFHSLPVPELTLSKSGIKRDNGRFLEMLIFQHFQLPVHFIKDKNGGSKVKVTYM